MKAIAAALAALVSAAGIGRASADPLAEWAGQWQGSCTIAPAYRGVSSISATLTIAPAGNGRYAWRTVYEENAAMQRVVKDYELVAVDAAKGRYVLDEKNGLKLDAYLAARALHVYFRIGGSRIPTIYVLQNVLISSREIVAALPAFDQAPAGKTCAGEQCAESYRLTAAQICRFRSQ